MPHTLQEFKADLFRVLANPVRIRILEALRAGGELTVGEIQQRLDVEASNVSQHLAILRQHHLVSARREGTSAWYSVSATDLFQMLDVARAIFEEQLREQSRMLDEERVQS